MNRLHAGLLNARREPTNDLFPVPTPRPLEEFRPAVERAASYTRDDVQRCGTRNRLDVDGANEDHIGIISKQYEASVWPERHTVPPSPPVLFAAFGFPRTKPDKLH